MALTVVLLADGQEIGQEEGLPDSRRAVVAAADRLFTVLEDARCDAAWELQHGEAAMRLDNIQRAGAGSLLDELAIAIAEGGNEGP